MDARQYWAEYLQILFLPRDQNSIVSSRRPVISDQRKSFCSKSSRVFRWLVDAKNTSKSPLIAFLFDENPFITMFGIMQTTEQNYRWDPFIDLPLYPIQVYLSIWLRQATQPIIGTNALSTYQYSFFYRCDGRIPEENVSEVDQALNSLERNS